MRRIRHLDGRLSDMINLSRAKDAATSLALGILNGDKRLAVASPMRESESAATVLPSEPEPLQEPAG
jgi:hypothetical protein